MILISGLAEGREIDKDEILRCKLNDVNCKLNIRILKYQDIEIIGY